MEGVMPDGSWDGLHPPPYGLSSYGKWMIDVLVKIPQKYSTAVLDLHL